jgi:DNA-binding response OmpR family regulator
LSPGHILLVDDDALLRRSLAFNLGQAGYRVSTAANAEQALAISAQDHPVLVLLDIGLPGMDGLDALQRFRARLNVPVIFLTARDRRLDEALGLEWGADDYVTKPFDIDVLLACIEQEIQRLSDDRHGVVRCLLTDARTKLDQLVQALLHDETIDQDALADILGPRPGFIEPILEEGNNAPEDYGNIGSVEELAIDPKKGYVTRVGSPRGTPVGAKGGHYPLFAG